MKEEEIEHTFNYNTPNTKSISDIHAIRGITKKMCKLILHHVPDSQERENALRHLQEVAFWCNAGIVRNQDSFNSKQLIENKE